MTQTAPFAALDLSGGGLAGPFRHPVNVSREAVGSIHDDDTAQKLGFRGGTVAGNIHMEQFPPLFAARFGQAWTSPGGLSLYFLQPTTDGEPVQACLGPVMADGAGVRRAEAWSGGDLTDSPLRRRLADMRPGGDLRILGASKVGDSVAQIPARIDQASALVRVRGVTEPTPGYVTPDASGRLLAAPAVVIDALRAVETPLFKSEGDFVGMFGAIELQHLSGAVYLDCDYLAEGEILALGESPKTEIAWFESRLRATAEGPVIARLLMMTRLLKDSSPLWA